MADDVATEPPPRLTGDYETWTYGPGAAYAGLGVPLVEARYVEAIVQLPPGADLRDFDRIGHGHADARLRHPLIWPGFTPDPSAPSYWPVILDFQEPSLNGPLDIARIERQLDRLSDPVRRVLITAGLNGSPAFRLGPPLRPRTISSASAQPSAMPDASLAAKIAAGEMPAIVAVIDDGIPFAHRNLLDAAGEGTRIECCWLQSADADASASVPFGREFGRAAIDALLGQHGPDEDALYARAGAVGLADGRFPTIGRLASHGAHVLDAAAGRCKDDPFDIDLLRIIAVQLPSAVTADTSGYRKDASVLAALHYIFDRADRFAALHLGNAAAPLPLIVNLSYGYTGGPHDGSATLEVAMAQLIAARQAQGKPTTLVMPAGNSFGERLAGEISAARLSGGTPYPIPWRLQPDDRTSNYLELWLRRGDRPSQFTLSIVDPAGRSCLDSAEQLAFVSPASNAQAPGSLGSDEISRNGHVIGRCVIATYNRDWTRILITLAPTEPEDVRLPGAMAGCWSVVLGQTGGAPLTAPVACRIQRDSIPFGYPRGARQSYFDDPADRRFSDDGAPARIDNPPGAFVRRLGTLNGIATHAQVTVVSGFYGDTGRATEYGSSGPLREPQAAAGPGDVRTSVMTDASTALRGTLAAGTRSGSVVRMSGTSMAAPQVARAIATHHLANRPALVQAAPLRHPADPRERAERSTRLG